MSQYYILQVKNTRYVITTFVRPAFAGVSTIGVIT